MAIFFIAAIGCLLFILFLKGLAQAEPHFLLDVVKWTGLSLLILAVALFILSGRLIFATLLVGFLSVIFWSRKELWPQEKKETLLLHKPLDLETAQQLLGLAEFSQWKDIEEAYEKSVAKAKEMAKQSNAKGQTEEALARLRQARNLLKETL